MKMTGYTKLFGSILASSIWQESNETRLVWITMLASANRWGVVEASIPGLAHMAKLGLEDTKRAIEILESPDEYSRTPDYEGRRIEKVDGGWQILNHDKYREKMSADERREYNRQKQAEFRERKKLRNQNALLSCQHVSIAVNDSQSQSALSAHADTEAKADAEELVQPYVQHPASPFVLSGDDLPLNAPTKPSTPPDAAFDEFWRHYPKKIGKFEARKAWAKLKPRPSLSELLSAIETQSRSDGWKRERGQFIPNPATWLNQGRWMDEVTTTTQRDDYEF